MKLKKDLALQYKKWVKARLTTIRVMGVFMSLLAIFLMGMQFFEIIDGFMNCISLVYICGFLFTLNAQYQDMCLNKKFAKASRIIAAILYLATVSLCVLIILDRFFVISL